MPVKINWPAVGAVAIPNLGGIATALCTHNNVVTWYPTLKKPKCAPPNWVFGPAWTIIYSTIGYASYVVFRDGGGFEGDARLPLIAYGGNLLLNWAWMPIFFGSKKLDVALYEIQLVNLTAVVTGVLFHKINPVAGYLLIPYGLWLGFATYLNYGFWKENKDSPKITEIKDK